MTESIEKKIAKNPEVVEKATRRRFTTEYKERIATEAEQCSKPGELGSLLRREGLYSSTVQRWRRQLQESSMSPSKKPTRTSPSSYFSIWSNPMSSESKPTISLNLPVLGGGQIQAAVWENEQAKDGETFTSFGVTFQRRYFDDEDNKWKSAKGFKDSDLLTLSFAAQELYRKVQEQKQK